MSKQYFCVVCEKPFAMGENGTFDENDKPVCDVCAGVERDEEGNPWCPGETEKTFGDVGDEWNITITREEAFGNQKDIFDE